MKSKEKSVPSRHSRQSFLEWCDSAPIGQALRKSQANYLQNLLKLTYNRSILQVGRFGAEDAYIGDELRRNFLLVEEGGAPGACGFARAFAKADELPFPHESMDVVILPHLLEFEEEPKRALEEAWRVLKPEGRLVILGFNPWSPSGLLRAVPLRAAPWGKRGIGALQLMNWLHLLKFEPEFDAGFGLARDRAWVEPRNLYQKSMACLAAAYAVKAVKRTYTLIPVRSVWFGARGFVPERAPSPLSTCVCGNFDQR
jgi:SAM-dependent methyltransferase